MPVIKGTAQVSQITAPQRESIADQLKKELAGQTTNGPTIFEIPLQSERFDVLVVWADWEPFTAEDRSKMIIDAYGEDRKKRIAQALGVTYQEAIEQQVLPYAVWPMIRKGEIDLEKLKKAMLEQGGIALPGGKVDLRFPTMALAEAAHKKLTDEIPKGYWSIVQSITPIPLS